MLALAAALAAACFVKAYRHHLPRPAAQPRRRKPRTRSTASRSRRWSILAALCLLAGILPGPVIDALAPVDRRRSCGSRLPVQSELPWLSIMPIAESRSSYNGLLVLVFITVSASLRLSRDPSLRLAARAARAGLGLRLLRRRARWRSIRPDSFAQPIRRVFGTLLFHARDHVEMPPPGRHRGRRGSRSNCTTWSGRDSTRRSPARSASPPTGSTACSS